MTMTFGEKLKEARLALNLSQTELSQMTGISERSLYTYEQLGTIPRKSNIRKLAEALHISVSYLLDEDETDTQSHIDEDMFIADAKEKSGKITCGPSKIFQSHMVIPPEYQKCADSCQNTQDRIYPYHQRRKDHKHRDKNISHCDL